MFDVESSTKVEYEEGGCISVSFILYPEHIEAHVSPVFYGGLERRLITKNGRMGVLTLCL